MSDNGDKRILKEIDRVLETMKAEAERRGIDTRGKSMEEIKKLLADQEKSPPDPSSKSKHSGDVNVQAKLIVDIATGEAEKRSEIPRKPK